MAHGERSREPRGPRAPGNLGTHVVNVDSCFVYADPPYYLKGRELYLSYYGDADHQAFAELMCREATCSWVITYDDVPRIRELYEEQQIHSFNLRYSAHRASTNGHEVLVAPAHVTIPEEALAILE